MSNITIRQAVASDAATIAEYNIAIAWETEEKRLDPALIVPGVARVFDDAAKGFYLVAEQVGRVVGQLMITFEWSDWRNGWIWWIQSVYVHPESRRLGVFGKLFAAVEERANTQGEVVGIRLYVENENERAMKTYEKQGMVDAAYRVYEKML